MSMMEWNSKTTSDWDWENFAIEIPKRVQRSDHDTGGNEVMDNRLIYSYSDFGHGSSSKSSMSSSKQAIDGFVKDFRGVDKNGSFPTCVGSSEPMIGLKLGRETYFEDACGTPTTNKTMSFSVMPKSAPPIPTTKRSRASYHATHTPRCQVEGCSLDLGSAKEYHRRHRICESHSKSPKVIVAGMERRFCQQCSRFHDLSEFDEKKRSCRRRLSDHNARRRRPQTEAIPFRSTQLSSSLYDQRPRMNFLMSPFSIPVSNPTWDNDRSFKVGESMVNPLKGGAIERRPTFPSDEIPNNISMLHLDSDRLSSFHGITSQVLNHGSNASNIASNMDVAPEFQQALSLLSTNSWGLNEPEQHTPLDQLMHGNHITHSEPQKWALATSESLDLHNVGGTQFQEFQLFKTCDSFYSNQIN